MFDFSEDYRVGIQEIDREHEGLFALLNGAIDRLGERKESPAAIAGNFLGELKKYAAEHFSHEEAYMEKIEDKELSRQRGEHEAFAEALEHFYIHDNLKEAELRDLISYVVKWLFGHILASDMMIGKVRRDIPADAFTFTDKYKTDIAFIDEEHRTLFDIVREANALVTDDSLYDKYDAIMGILDRLRGYSEEHFRHEEEYMAKIGYPKLELQKTAHNAFVEKLIHIDIKEMRQIDEDQQAYLTELIDYLLSWLSAHILHMDRQIAEWERGL